MISLEVNSLRSQDGCGKTCNAKECSFPPQQLLREITGETLGADHYVRYLREKYEEIYQKIED